MANATPIVFVVDDDVSVRESLEGLIQSEGWEVETFASAQAFLTRPRVTVPSCLVLDVTLPDLSDMTLAEIGQALEDSSLHLGPVMGVTSGVFYEAYLDGERLFRASQLALAGADEKRIHAVEFKNLPAGNYTLRAEVLGADDVRGMAEQELVVSGAGHW